MRRKFLEAEPDARAVLEKIAALYAIEAETRGDPEARRARRASESKPLVAAIERWILAQRALPQSSLGKALVFTAGCWPGLVRFLEDPAIPLDNIASERALRGLVLGRKNDYGSKFQRGTEVAALFYSLLESAKLADQEPATYLAEATRRALANSGAVTQPCDLASA